MKGRLEKVWRGHHPDSMVAKFAEDCDNIGVKVGNMADCQEENFDRMIMAEVEAGG